MRILSRDPIAQNANLLKSDNVQHIPQQEEGSPFGRHALKRTRSLTHTDNRIKAATYVTRLGN